MNFCTEFNKGHKLLHVSIVKCIILTMAYSQKSVGIVTDCISDHNDTNKSNNCFNLICTLNDWLITLSYLELVTVIGTKKSSN